VDSLTPDSGDLAGGYQVNITGFGFNFTEEETIVRVGYNNLTGGSEIQIVDTNTIVALSWPPEVLGIPVAVTVETPISESNAVSFTYVNGVPIAFKRGLLWELYAPTTLAFGPVRPLIAHNFVVAQVTHFICSATLTLRMANST